MADSSDAKGMDPNLQEYDNDDESRPGLNEDRAEYVNDPDVDEDEDTDDESFDPNHRLLDRVQKKLYDQLRARKEKIEIKIRDRKEAVARITKQREQIGVELYGFQQQLAKLQQHLEAKHDFTAQTKEERDVAEKRSSYLTSILEEAERRRSEADKKHKEEQKKLNEIRITLKQIEEHNKQLQGEIKVTRRAAIGTEESMKEVEKQKKVQDFLIDELNETIKSNMEQIRLYESQIASQTKQTDIAKDTLRGAEKEIENINVQKREYMQRWKTSLIGIKRRDESLQTAQTALEKLKEKEQGTIVEIIGMRKNIAEEQAKNERLTGLQTKLETELKFLETQNIQIVEDLNMKQERYEVVQNSLATTEEQLKKERQLTKREQEVVKAMHKNIEKLMQQRQSIDSKIEMELKGDINTLKRGKQSTVKSIIKLREDIRKKELELASTKNDLARIRVDVLNTKAFNKQLAVTLKEYEGELKEKDDIISKYENELKAGTLKIERKQIYIARLNKKYDELVGNQDEENTGPLEAVIKTLRKDIDQYKNETAHHQRKWIGLQNTLVNLVQETEQIEKKVKEFRSRISVLEQKNLRIKNENIAEVSESRALEAIMRHLHFDAKKLNNLIAKSELLAKEIDSSNYTIEQDFSNELKILSDEAKQRSKRIESLKDEKEDAIQKVIEAEKTIMLLEKKIQLERETHAAIDPEYGQPEIKGMKKEIHRMELRLTQLKKQQEMMIQQMEKSIVRRQMIEQGHEASKSKSESKASLRKKISALKNALKANMREYKKLEFQSSQEENRGKDIFTHVETMRRKLGQVEDERINIEEDVQLNRISRRINEGLLMLLEKRCRTSQNLLRKKTFSQADHELALVGLSKESETAKRIGEVLRSIQQQYPKFGAYMQRIHEFMQE